MPSPNRQRNQSIYARKRTDLRLYSTWNRVLTPLPFPLPHPLPPFREPLIYQFADRGGRVHFSSVSEGVYLPSPECVCHLYDSTGEIRSALHLALHPLLGPLLLGKGSGRYWLGVVSLESEGGREVSSSGDVL